MAVGLLVFLVCVTFFTFGKAAPLIYKSAGGEPGEDKFRGQMETLRRIYVGAEVPVQEEMEHLVIVTGHAILLDQGNYQNDDAWVLESFQRGQVAVFAEHILKGMEIVQSDPNAILVFTGYSPVARI
jgi:hypothetical protein